MAEMTFDGTFSDLKLKVMSEAALQAIYPELVKLQDFAHTYSELEDRPGPSIVIPTYDLSAAADFGEGTNDYGTGVNEIGASNVTLNKHLVKSISITDRDIGDTGVQFVKDGAEAISTASPTRHIRIRCVCPCLPVRALFQRSSPRAARNRKAKAPSRYAGLYRRSSSTSMAVPPQKTKVSPSPAVASRSVKEASPLSCPAGSAIVCVSQFSPYRPERRSSLSPSEATRHLTR